MRMARQGSMLLELPLRRESLLSGRTLFGAIRRSLGMHWSR